MQRRDFIRLCGVLGLSVPLAACGSDSGFNIDVDIDFERNDATGSDIESVIVVGAGAAGMSAAHLLARRGIDVQVLEAASSYGGRIRTISDFVDFPIPLGGEWLHADHDELQTIVDDNSITVTTETVGYSDDDIAGEVHDGELTLGPMEPDDDRKLVGVTWLGFFEQYLLPDIADLITYDTPVERIEHSNDGVTVTDTAGTDHRADAVIVTVPLTILRDGDIDFVPALSADKRAVLDAAEIWGGMKVFVEFSEAFYPTFVQFPDSATAAGQRLYYDAAYGQDTDRHVLGLFSVGAQAEPYQAVADDDAALLDHILGELDAIFDGAASRSYIQHVAQNWSDEPFIRQAYLSDEADESQPRTLGEPGGKRLYFAGDAYTDGESWSEVHTAAKSARRAVNDLLA